MCSWKETGKMLFAVFALALLISMVAGKWFVGLAGANPYYYAGEVPAGADTYPPVISVSSPENNTVQAVNRLSLVFNVTAPQSKTAYSTAIMQVSYKADWMMKAIDVFPNRHEQLDFLFTLSDIPEGKHTILVQAVGMGSYVEQLTYTNFYISSSSLICFTVDATAPFVSVLSVENKTYDKTSVLLNFTVNEAASQIAYSLDGQENVTVSGNLTLHGLSDGAHNLTFYAKDHAGNIGASETINFTITTVDGKVA